MRRWVGWKYYRVHGVPLEERASGATTKIPTVCRGGVGTRAVIRGKGEGEWGGTQTDRTWKSKIINKIEHHQ